VGKDFVLRFGVCACSHDEPLPSGHEQAIRIDRDKNGKSLCGRGRVELPARKLYGCIEAPYNGAFSGKRLGDPWSKVPLSS